MKDEATPEQLEIARRIVDSIRQALRKGPAMTNDQTVTQALEPCPWCGTSEHLSVQSGSVLTSDMPDRPYRTICTHIDHDTVIGPTAYGKRAAITAWNTRTAHSGEGRSIPDVRMHHELIEAAVQAALDAGLAENGGHGVAAARHAARFIAEQREYWREYERAELADEVRQIKEARECRGGDTSIGASAKAQAIADQLYPAGSKAANGRNYAAFNGALAVLADGEGRSNGAGEDLARDFCDNWRGNLPSYIEPALAEFLAQRLTALNARQSGEGERL